MQPRSFVVLSVHKTGSMLLFQMLEALAKMSGRTLVSDNLPSPPWNQYGQFRDRLYDGHLFGPLRSISIFADADFSRLDTVCHLRDPRDVLTSYYFSLMYSHQRNPTVDARAKHFAEIGIDAAVLEMADMFLRRYMDYVLAHKLWGFPILTYEEMVTDFPRWLDKFLQFLPPPVISVARKYFIQAHGSSFDVKSEDIHSHKRRVTPGDHKEKLKPETIAELNDIFAPVLRFLGRFDSTRARAAG